MRNQWIRITAFGIALLLFGFPVTQYGIKNANAEQSFNIFLPIVLRDYIRASLFGVEFQIWADDSTQSIQTIAKASPNWTRYNGFLWSDIAPDVSTQRNWASAAHQESKLIEFSQNGMETILIISGTPVWAQAKPGKYCGPIKMDVLDEFADFLTDLVARYSVSPYNVKYWEIWNEPDVDPSMVSGGSSYGCWGDQNDLYYGGGYYAEMLKVAYPAIKTADPQAQVLVGGLLLDCDPRNPPVGKTCSSAKFLEGILLAGGSPYFDGISFHAYDYYDGDLGHFTNNNWHSSWNTTGVVTSAKANYLRDVLAQYGTTNKFLMNTETAIICDTCLGNQDYEQTKAYYIAQSYATAIALDLKANIWYSATGWRTSGLLDDNLNPLPGYSAFAFARKKIGNLSFQSVLSFPGVMGYEFSDGRDPLWLLWSLDGAEHAVTLPGIPTTAYDVFGNELPISGNTWNTSIAPVYLEWTK